MLAIALLSYTQFELNCHTNHKKIWNFSHCKHTHTRMCATRGAQHMAAYQSNVSYVVPDVCSCLVGRGEVESPLQAGERHVVLLGVEAAEAKVCEELGIVYSNLE